MKTSRSLIRLPAVLSSALVLSTPSTGSTDVAESLGKGAAPAVSRATATPRRRDATRDAGDF
jgi:hypothetical protein